MNAASPTLSSVKSVVAATRLLQPPHRMAHAPSALQENCTVPTSKFAFSSSNVPLLSTLHELITEYETAVKHVYEVRDKYGLKPGFDLEPPSGGLFEKMKRHQKAFDAVSKHVDDVNMLIAHDHIVLRREACGAANDLYRAPPSEAEEQDKQRTIFTRSPILRYSSQLGLSFRPFPSNELLCQSSILSNSQDLRELAAPLTPLV